VAINIDPGVLVLLGPAAMAVVVLLILHMIVKFEAPKSKRYGGKASAPRKDRV
jgi:hypothetical protein